MKKWFMKCPFCANEIKEWATKCQYCEEFLDWRTEKKGKNTSKNNEKNNKKWFFYRFFRRDLELNKKRGHRLIKIIFWILMLILLIQTLIIPSFNEIKNPDKIYEVVEPLQNRFTTELVNLPDILNKWEIVYYDKTFWALLFYVWRVWEDKYRPISQEDLDRFMDMYWWNEKNLSAYYCSTKLADNFSKLKKITGMTDVRAYEWANDVVWRNIDTDLNKIKKYINENYIKQYTDVDKINCIAAKKYPSFECLDFTRRNINDKYIFKESVLLTRISVASHILTLLFINGIMIWIIVSILLIIYYKLIIYIIYWSYNKNNS